MDPETYEIAAAAGQLPERERLLTYQQAAAISGRTPESIRKFVQTGVLPSRYQQTVWPYRKLVLESDLDRLAKRPRWGVKRGRKAKPHITEGGKTIALRGQTRTDSWEG